MEVEENCHYKFSIVKNDTRAHNYWPPLQKFQGEIQIDDFKEFLFKNETSRKVTTYFLALPVLT